MRSIVLLVTTLLAASACGGGGSDSITALELEVVVTQDNVTLHAYEVERAFDCNQKVWLDPGDCDETTDAFFCETEPPASCIDAIRVEEDGLPIDDGIYDADFQDGILTVDGAPARTLELVVEGCGGEARIPIAPTTVPTPAIVDASTVGSDMVVQWNSDDATATGVVGWSSGFGGPRCHVDRGQTASLPAPTNNPTFLEVYVQAFTAAVEHGTGLGLARVRTKGSVGQEL